MFCKSCRWWQRGRRAWRPNIKKREWSIVDPMGNVYEYGDCRINAPAVPPNDDASSWPWVHEEDWCRLHTPSVQHPITEQLSSE